MLNVSPGPPASCIHPELFLGVMIVEAPALINLLAAKIRTRASCEETELSGQMKCPWWAAVPACTCLAGVHKLCSDEVLSTEGGK